MRNSPMKKIIIKVDKKLWKVIQLKKKAKHFSFPSDYIRRNRILKLSKSV